MDSLELDFAAGLLDGRQPPCLSLYQPTHRRHPENQQDPIRFRNLVKVLRESLLKRYPKQDAGPLLDPFAALADDRDFWNHTADGLAVLAGSGLFRVYRLQRSVRELVVVADTFHTKPLLRILQSVDRYQILGLSRQGIRLFEGNRDRLDEIEPAAGIPRTRVEALGEEQAQPHLTVASYGGAGGAQSPMRHGHGEKESQVDAGTERFFRSVDRGVTEHHSRPTKLPLMLVSLPEHRALFQRVSKNPFLIAEGVDIDPEALTANELRTRAWQVVEPSYRARLAVLSEEFGRARSKGLGCEDLEEAARAIMSGRVETLIIEADRELPGRIDTTSGAITFDDLAHPDVDDVLDDLAALASRRGGRVVVVPAERMPTKTGIAAICKF
jgi:hypothetical protein